MTKEQICHGHAEDRPAVYCNISPTEINMPLIMGAGYRISTSAFWHDPRTCLGNLIVYFLEGSASTILVDSGKILTTRGGTFYSLPPGVTHCPSSDNFEPHTAIWFQFPSPSHETIHNTTIALKEYQSIFKSLVALGPAVYAVTPRLHVALRDCIALITRHGQESVPFFAPTIRTQICNILLETLTCMRGLESYPDTNFSQAIRDYIAAHYREPIQIRDMAIYMGYDETWFKKRFKREIGFTPNHYLQHHRIGVARGLLCNTDQTITDIAFQVGFESSQYFSHVFKKITGMTPRRCRTIGCQTFKL